MNQSMNKGNIVTTAKTAFCGILAVSMMALSGCASAPVKHQTAFFPPAPEEPRLQFLKGVSGSKDIEVAETGVSHSLKSFAIGEEGETKPIVKPFGLRYVGGKLYVCDPKGHNVTIIDFEKNSYSQFTGNGSGKLKQPLNVAVDADGSMYVLDVGRHNQVVHFEPNGDYASTIDLSEALKGAGKEAKEAAKDSQPAEVKFKASDVAVDNTSIYVLDMIASDIKVFNKKTGKYLRSIGGYVEGQGGLNMPTNMTIGADGHIYITNMASGSVVILEKSGKVAGSFGKMGDGFGDFARPKGISVGTEGRVWVVDGGLQNVQLFQADSKHRLLISVGDPGLPEGSLDLPAGIALTSDDVSYWQQFAAPGFILEEVAFVSNQDGPVKISIYGLGHREDKTGKKAAEPAQSQGAEKK
jgi:DNA-binding beta-propeller fold protein YncE